MSITRFTARAAAVASLCLAAVASFLWARPADPAPTPAGDKAGLIPRKVFFGNPDARSPQLSPDGKYVAWLAPSDGVMNVFVAPADDLGAKKVVTKEKKRGVPSFSWAYTNKHILYSQDKDGDENYRLYGVDVGSGEIKDLTPLEKVRAEMVHSSPKFPKEVLVGLNDRDPQYHDLYRVDVTTGDRTLLQKNPDFAGFVADDDYRVRFAEKFAKDGGLQVYKPDGKDGWAEFFKVPMEDSETTNIVGFDKTGDVLYLMDSRGRNTGALATFDLKTDKETVVAEDPKADVGGVLLHPTEHTVQAVSFTYDRTRWDFKDDAVAADFKEIKKSTKHEDGELAVVSRTLDDKTWVVAVATADGPVYYYVYDRPAKKARFLFTNRKALEGLALRKMTPKVIKSRDGLDLVCYLTLPASAEPDAAGTPKKPVPMVLFVHGGPWARDGWGFNPYHQWLANRGYAVLSVNFRGSTGFGKKFLNAANKEWAGKMHDDLLDAVDWAVKEKIADPDKVAIMGGSYGGYATLVGLTFTPDKFACGVDIVGPSNLVTLLNTIPPYWAPGLQLFKDRVGDHTTEDGKKELLAKSPLSRVDKIKRPLLVGQGANDPRVKQAEADQVIKAMQDKKLPVTYVLFPDEGHGFQRPENNMAFSAVTEAFLAKHLGGRYEAVGDDFTGSSITVPTGAEDVPGLAAKLPGKDKPDR
jgi:dipeptidyl aminopeptidase/acylaminoacyl peptidase